MKDKVVFIEQVSNKVIELMSSMKDESVEMQLSVCSTLLARVFLLVPEKMLEDVVVEMTTAIAVTTKTSSMIPEGIKPVIGCSFTFDKTVH